MADAMRWMGTLGVALYASHAAYNVVWGFPENLLWFCHLGALLGGLGLWLRSPVVNGVGLCWLAVGVPCWGVGVLMGGSLVATSVLTHLGGLAVALWGVRRLAFPAGTWWKALAGMALLHFVTRPLNPQDRNVNFAGGVWHGLEPVFPTHATFLVAVALVSAGVFAVLERQLRRRQAGAD